MSPASKYTTPPAVAEARKEARKRVLLLNAAIAKLGISQRMLAERASMDQPSVNRVLRHKVQAPTFATLLRLEQAVTYFQNQLDKATTRRSDR